MGWFLIGNGNVLRRNTDCNSMNYEPEMSADHERQREFSRGRNFRGGHRRESNRGFRDQKERTRGFRGRSSGYQNRIVSTADPYYGEQQNRCSEAVVAGKADATLVNCNTPDTAVNPNVDQYDSAATPREDSIITGLSETRKSEGAVPKVKQKAEFLQGKKYPDRGSRNVFRSQYQSTGFRGAYHSKPYNNEYSGGNSDPYSSKSRGFAQKNNVHESGLSGNVPNKASLRSDRLNLLQHVSNTFNADFTNATTPAGLSDGSATYVNGDFGGGSNVKEFMSAKEKFRQRNRAEAASQRRNGQVYPMDNSVEASKETSYNKNVVPKSSQENVDKNAEHHPQQSSKQHLTRPKLKRMKEEDDASQRDRLIDQLSHNACECMVCCDRVRTQDSIWSCHNCFHVFHLRCIRKWARSPAAIVEGAGWRCPACQQVTEKVPNQYRCFCGKMRDPEWNRYETPHSCAEQCGKQRLQNNCPHRCNLLCHPGPCPPCQVQVTRNCECGKTAQPVRCGHTGSILCSGKCEKPLNCGAHVCQLQCHAGQCAVCNVTVRQTCCCGSTSREVACTQETAGKDFFTCDSVCNKLLSCGLHTCNRKCHEGLCDLCNLLPEFITHCPCGQVPLEDILPKGTQRTKCTDPVPVCGKICNKILACGPRDFPHRCTVVCHSGPCPQCSLVTEAKCRCGMQTLEIPCERLTTVSEVCCEKKCNKKRSCGRHKCLQKCCIDQDHRCQMLCNRKLPCGLHTCEELCHRGNCPPCWHTSFDELACHCGASVMFPPIPCGTKPPECKEVCARTHSCHHPVTHNCHSEDKCPPCTYLTEKWCYGGHELRSNVPCYLVDISCGLPCNKPLPCGMHTCQLTCHPGPCLKNGEVCTQPCNVERSQCGHPCAAPCHQNKPCPNSNCRTKVSVTCQCGHLSEKIKCAENLRAMQRIAASAMASRLSDMQSGQSIDISDMIKAPTSSKNKRLECNEECFLMERNRRVALALQIRNPELTNKLGPPSYSDFLKDQVKQNASLVTSVYNRLTEVVQNAKQSKQKSRSFAFPPMNRDHRRVVHELAEFFGCETTSYDEEPKKNVVATAFRDKSWLPSVSVMTVVERESVIRKAPPPIPHKSQLQAKNENGETINPKMTSLETMPPPETVKEPVIDYFDYNPEL